jgi:HAD superfamily phosphatase (TIGR01668 family)
MRFRFRNRIPWLRPTSFARRITDIDLAPLHRAGIAGIVLDLDNTLVGYREVGPAAEVEAWVAGALASGFRVAILTNNRTSWALDIARRLNLPAITDARKPLAAGFRRARAVLDVPNEALLVVGDQLFTDVLGARMAGLAVILTEPLVKGDRWHILVLRVVEKLLVARPKTP